MKPTKLVIVFSVLTFISLSVVGCYTMLSHPVVDDSAVAEDNALLSTGESMEVDYSHDCLQCHSAKTHTYINRFYNHYYDNEQPVSAYYWDYAPRAQYYYSSPWWLNDYFSGAAVAMPGSKKEDALPRPNDYSRRRQPSRSSYSGAASSSGSGYSGGASVSSSSSSSSSSNETKQYSPSKKRPAKTKSRSSDTSKSNSSSKSKSKSKNKKK